MKRARVVLLLAAALLVVPTLGGIVWLSFEVPLQMAEQRALGLRLTDFLPPEDMNPDIVVVGITEDTLASFHYRSPVDREFLANLLASLEALGARAIGLDILFDQPSEEAKDHALQAAIRDLHIPVAVAALEPQDGLTPAQASYLDGFVPRKDRGFILLPHDSTDDIVRQFEMKRTLADGSIQPSLIALVAQKLGAAVPDGPMYISWRGQPQNGGPPFLSIPAQSVNTIPRQFLQNKIVLIGVFLPYEDRVRTPFSPFTEGGDGSGATMPGVLVLAHALSTVLDSRAPSTWSASTMEGAVAGAFIVGGALTWLLNSLLLRVLIDWAVVVTFWSAAFLLIRYHVYLPLITPTICFVLSAALVGFCTRKAHCD